jgi:hypothetical protein
MLEWLTQGFEIDDGGGTQVARLDKPLYVRLKPQARQA